MPDKGVPPPPCKTAPAEAEESEICPFCNGLFILLDLKNINGGIFDIYTTINLILSTQTDRV